MQVIVIPFSTETDEVGKYDALHPVDQVLECYKLCDPSIVIYTRSPFVLEAFDNMSKVIDIEFNLYGSDHSYTKDDMCILYQEITGRVYNILDEEYIVGKKY